MPQSPSDPDGAGAHLRRGDALRELRRFREAIASYMEALGAEPESAAPWAGIGMAHLGLKDWREAEKAFAEAVRRAPAEGRYLAWHSLVVSDLGHWRQGLDRASRATAVEPALPLAHAAAAHAWLQGRQPWRAEASARAALALNPREGFAMRLLAIALWKQGRRDEHGVVARQLLELDPTHADHLEQAGWAALVGGDAVRAGELLT